MDVDIREPFPEWAWPQVWYWSRLVAQKVEDDFSPKTLPDFVEHSMELATRSRTWGVWRGADLGGLIAAEPASPVVVLAHLIFKKAFWGGAAEEAARMALREGFQAGVWKVCGLVFADNHAVRGMYHRLGFREEGTLRGQTLRGGEPVDVVACGMTKGDWERVNSGVGRTTRSKKRLRKQSDKHKQQLDGEHIHAGRDGGTDTARLDAVRGTDGPTGDTCGIGGDRRDQQEHFGTDRPDEQVPGAAGIHQERDDGAEPRQD